MMKAAIVGFGTISIVHIDAIASNPGMELVAICDINEELAAKVPEGVKFYTDYKKMAEEVKPDVIHNLLPHYLHYPVTKELVEMGFNVFCEKPIFKVMCLAKVVFVTFALVNKYPFIYIFDI